MYRDGETFFTTSRHERAYVMPAMPAGAREGILKGIYRFRAASNKKAKLRAQLFAAARF